MKKICVRYNRVSKVERGIVFIEAKGFKDKKIPIAFTKLIGLLDNKKGTSDGEMIYAKWVHDIGDDMFVFEEPLAVCIADLVKTIREVVQEAYDKGKEDGKSILIQLNDGGLSMDDFNKK